MIVTPSQQYSPSQTLELLLESTIKRRFGAGARVAQWRERPLGPQGYSGAVVRVYDVDVVDGCSLYDVPLVTKDVYLIERQAMSLLNDHAYPNVPYSFSFDYSTNERMMLCQQYIEANSEPQAAPTVKQAALDLARIHAEHMGRARAHGWLPHADNAYFSGDFIVQNWYDGWAESLQDPNFAATYGGYTGAMEDAADYFLRGMQKLWEDGDTLTLVHCDLHGGNILVQEGYPFVIDWEMARYGTFYIDLPNYFSPENSLVYRDALESLGYHVPLATFKQCYADVTRSLGFRYMTFWLDYWARGGAARERSRAPLASLITTAITGEPILPCVFLD